jgi:hypothetical protein
MESMTPWREAACQIMDAAARDIVDAPYPFVFNLSASLATQLASLRTGWKSAGPLETAHWRAPERPAGCSSARTKHRPPLAHSPAT